MESYWFATHPPKTDFTAAFSAGAHYDVVVAGAGLTGLTTALLLARTGLTVAVVEARSVGAVTTGNTTAKLSLLQGLSLSGIRSHQSEKVLRAYVEGQREGQAWLVRFLETEGVEFQRRTAYTYATTSDGAGKLRKELEACQAAGLEEVVWTDQTELPFATTGALTMLDQAQIHPLTVLDALAGQLLAHNGVVFENTRLLNAEGDSPVRVTTNRGELTAGRVVLATGTPQLDRGGYFAKLVPSRSYATAHRVSSGQIPQGMYLSADSPTHSLRTLDDGPEQLLMVGGHGHTVGRADSEAAALQSLVAWADSVFPGLEMTHSWSAQDYTTVDRVPYVGKLPGGHGDIFVATGYNKWGMTNAVAAALNLSAQLLGGSMPWAETLTDRGTSASAVGEALSANVKVAGHLAKDWLRGELSSLPDDPPAEGKGVVGRLDGKPVAASTVGGVTCRVSGVCTHLGGVVRWNDAEKSWDCPLHGSRFAADGTVLEGPALKDLGKA
ncbi:FAD-dependent oxidoreductase [Tessaracoccus sp. MC1865]|uniref:FAD-dependent oxidoreductase n=1 Tax=Tessaracoccus sp. MC1865 TaxID=2760310 RepID=UPI001602A2E0|nr:FAD-dependent oxidoreductase [Tessaracoccus sp. MC1865]MBB1483002.1 FAD-dependent oxidoreductase [Tessaracoccus sp. MC1865]QTO37562.1 FAD-dependent oxidoreductase [Tessaracoccus sp. MC1865]